MTLNEVTIKQEACGPKVYKNEIKIVIKKIKLNFSSVFQQLHNVNAKPAPGEKKTQQKSNQKPTTHPPQKNTKNKPKKTQKNQRSKFICQYDTSIARLELVGVLPGVKFWSSLEIFLK